MPELNRNAAQMPSLNAEHSLEGCSRAKSVRHSIIKHLILGALVALSSVAAVSAQNVAPTQLVAGYNGGNDQDGIMFDVRATSQLTIRRFDINLQPQTDTVEIYTRFGSHVGAENAATSWTRVGRATVTSVAAYVPTAIPISLAMPMQPGETRAFYITTITSGVPDVIYSDTTGGTPGVTVVAAADGLTLLSGTGKAYPFGASFVPRSFNGTIHYDVVIPAVPILTNSAMFALIVGIGLFGGLALRMRRVRRAATPLVVILIAIATSALSRPSDAACSFNFGGSPQASYLVDGLILSRYAQGITGPALLAGSGSARDPSVVANEIDANIRSLDIDGNNAFDLADAAIIARYLAGFRGDALVTPPLSTPPTPSYGAGAARATGAQIEAYIIGGCVPPPPVPPAGCVVTGASSVAVGVTEVYNVACTVGTFPFTTSWTRNALSGTSAAGLGMTISVVPFPVNGPDASATLGATVNNSAGGATASITIANASLDTISSTSASLAPGPASTVRQLQVNVSKSGICYSGEVLTVWINGAQAYSGPFVSQVTLPIQSGGDYRVETRLACAAPQSNSNTASTASLTVPDDAFTPTSVTDVEDATAPFTTGTILGTLPGSAGVNPSGAASYTIPLTLPPGTAGMQPALSLAFNSQAGRGILGTGWSLSGFSVIHRCPATVEIDGFKGAVDVRPYPNQDRFCLDGVRLVSLGGVDGANGTEYRTERDSYARITSYVDLPGYGINRWIVETKSGQTLTFAQPLYRGSTGDPDAAVDTLRAKVWGLNEARDTVGNTMTYGYAVNHLNGWLLPTSIAYTSNPNTGLAPHATVDMTYDYSVKPDTGVVYDGTGAYGLVPPLLSNITTRVDGSVAHRYNIGYESSPTTGRMRLTRIEQCGGGLGVADGLCVVPTQFTYNNAAVDANQPWRDVGSLGFGINPSRGEGMLPLDLNGTGKTQLLRSNTFSAFSFSGSGSGVTLNITNAGAAMALQLGTTNCVRDANISPACPTDVSMEPVLGDFNGDGYTDFITTVRLGYGGDTRNRYLVCLARPSSPFTMDCEIKLQWGDHDSFQSLEVLNGLGDGNYSYSPQTPKILVGDFDGDGKSDVLDLTSGTLYFDYAVGSYGKRRPVAIDGLVPSNPELLRKLAVSDFNGDGRMDIAVNSDTASLSTALAAQGFNRWASFLSDMRTTDGPGSDGLLATRRNSGVDGPKKRDQQPHIADVNGDGLADMVAFSGAPAAWLADPSQPLDPYLDQFQWQVCLSKGDGQFDCSIWFGPPSGELSFQNKKYPSEILGDFNGDGRTDLAIADLDGSYDFTANRSTDGPKRWLICVATSSQDAASPRGRFDCGSGVPQSTVSTLSGGGWWANGIRRDGLTQFNAATGERTYGFDIVAQGDFAGIGRTGLAGGKPLNGQPRITVPNVVDPVAAIPDMLASVTDGLGFTQRFKYAPITDSAVYQKAQDSPAYPVLNVQTAMFVVREMSQDDGLNGGGELRTTYAYRGLKGHVRGGGALGFESVTVRDEQTGFTSETRYDNSYPARGLVTAVVKRQADGRMLGRSTAGFRLVRPYTASSLTQQIHSYLPVFATEEAWDIDGSVLPSTVTQSSYGNANANDLNAVFGCATNVMAATYPSGTDPNGAGWNAGTPPSGTTALFKKTAVNAYDNGVGGWRFCRLRSVTVTSEQTAYPAETASETRTSTFRYNANTGLLDQEVIQPDTGNSEAALAAMLTTTYTHDAYGNRVQADVIGWNGTAAETRSSFITYDGRGRFATGSRNVLGHTQSRSFSPTLGTLQSETGPNGLTTTIKYDRLGRKVTEIRADHTKTSVRYGIAANPWGGLNVVTVASGGAQTSGDTDRLGREMRRGVLIADQGGSNASTRWSYVDTSYDARGRVSTVTRPYFAGSASLTPCNRSYDNLDRITSESCAQDSGIPPTTTQTAYSGLTTTVTVTALDATGASSTRASQSTLDARGQVLQTVNPQGSRVQHAYDAAGNLTRTTRTAPTSGSDRMVTVISYDLRSRKKALTDPDTGSYAYRYNAFGELIEQTDGKGQRTTMRYDALSRPTQRLSGVDLQSSFTYDTCYQGIGKLCSTSASGVASPGGAVNVEGYRRTLAYDALGRPISETSLIGNAGVGANNVQLIGGAAAQRSYVAQTNYDELGRVKQIRYPNGQWVTRQYDATGAWNKLVGSAGQTLWQGGTVDAEARLQNWTLGNGLSGSANFGSNTGRLASLSTSNSAQNLTLSYDGFGNIKTRLDSANGYSQANGAAETFRYDTLNQLTQASFFEGPQNITYDGFGRILTKTGVNAVAGAYQYKALATNGGTTSHQLQNAGGRNYSYDSNGNVDAITGTAAGSITLSWTSFNQPLTLPIAASAASSSSGSAANAMIQLRYGADQERRVELLPVDVNVTGANQTALRYVLNSGSALFFEEDVRADGSKEQRAYFAAPTGVIAVHTTNTDANGTPAIPSGAQANSQNLNSTSNAAGALQPSPYTLTYWVKDRLGSVTVTTDERGQIKERLRFDPWGKPMMSLGGVSSRNRTGDRGFTEHEHLAGGLIHMNGRIYDPVLGRFLSADIIVQFPDAITSYNRYAYVMNNPLGYTDPSGYFVAEIIAALIAIGNAVVAAAPYIAATAAVSGAVAYATGHRTAARRFFAAAAFFATLGTPYAPLGAMASGGIQSGSIEGAIVAGLSYGIGSMVGEIVGLANAGAFAQAENVATTSLSFADTVQMAANAQGGGARYASLAPGGVERVVITGSALQVIDTQMYQVTYGTFGAASALASGATQTEGVSISAKRYSPAVHEMLEFMKWGTPFGSLLSCASRYEECSGFGWGLAVAGVTPLGKGVHAAKVVANWRSVKQFGHTFNVHGAQNTQGLLGRASGTNSPQGQWLNNEYAANFLSTLNVSEATRVRIPDGLGRVIMPNGGFVQAQWATVIPGANGLRTAFPIIP